ncbi:MAG: hypothetical protein DRO13_05300 [Thermoprotei archaeon]|nr:MAG: hypothetical protein DRO13_05300 [Thermoprotei archaeon]
MLTKQIRSVREHFVSIEARPVSVYPGGSAESMLYINGSGVRVLVSATSSDSCVQILDIAPVSGRAPLQVRVVIAASPSARPGIYSIDVAATDPRQGRILASARIPVFVMDSSMLARAVEDVDRLRKLYREKGIQYAIVYALDRLGEGLRFSDIKLLYEFIVGHKISNGTVGDLLRRLVKKGILKRTGDLYYLAVDLEVARTVMDLKRARNGLRGALKTVNTKLNRVGNSHRESCGPPSAVKRVLKITRELLEKDYWMAVDFVAHTLLGIRKTGTWILWFDNHFVYRENKTGFLHYFRSPKLSTILKELGLKPGLMIEHEHHSSEKYILELYGSYANARRIHYLLKELGWFEYKEPLLLELSENYLAVKGLTSGETLFKHGVSNSSANTLRAIVFSGEHIDEENGETYFYRPSGLY